MFEVRPTQPPIDLLRRLEARLLARLPGVADQATDPATEPATDAGPAGPPARLADGEQRYAFGEVFASGGLGVIRRGEDRRLGRTIAIKELMKDSPQAQQRFALEAAITARLQHPGIVPLYDLGWQGSGRPYYCMKLVDGESLEAKIRGAGSLAARLRLLEHVVAVADAIAYAHEQQILHRDLKPANVLVGRFGETVVIDWGLAKDLSGQITAEVREQVEPTEPVHRTADMTEAGTVMGTLRYMPPEQAAGEPVDARSDVYALGALLHHVLCGSPPFAAVTGHALVARVLAGTFEDVRKADPGIPRELAAVAQRAMSRDPAARYPTAAAFAEDLRRFLAGRLVHAHAYSASEVAGLWLRRHRTAATVASVLVAALGVIGGLALVRISQAEAEAEQAAEAEAAAAERAARAAFEQRAEAAAGRAGEVLRLARTPGREREALALGVQVLAAGPAAAPEIAVDGVAEALTAMLPVATLSSEDHAVYAVRFSPDGSVLATLPWQTDPARDRVKIWSTSGALLATLPAGPTTAEQLAIDPDNRRLASSDGARCTVWDIASGAALQVLAGCSEPVFTRDGGALLGKVPDARHASTGRFAALAAWDVADGRARWSTELAGDNFVAQVHPDGRRIVVKLDHHAGERVEVLASATGQRVTTLAPPTPPGRYGPRSPGFVAQESLAVAPDGRHVAVAETADDGRLLLWDLEAATVRSLDVEGAAWRSLAFAGPDRLLAAGQSLEVIDVASGRREASLPGSWLATALGGSGIASDGEVLWRPTDSVVHQALAPGRPSQLIGSADGRHFATVTRSRATLWSTHDHLAASRWAPPRGHAVVSFSAAEAVTRDEAGTLWVHDRGASGRSLALVGDAATETEMARAWSVPGGVWRHVHTVVDADGEHASVNRLRFHAADTGAPRYALDDAGGSGWWATAAASRRTSRVAAATRDGGMFVDDAASGRRLCELGGDGSRIHALALSDGGAWAAGLRHTGEVVVWSVADCREAASVMAFGAAEAATEFKYLRSFAVGDAGALMVRYRDRTIVLGVDGAAPLDVTDPCRSSQPWGFSRLGPDGGTLLTSCESAENPDRGWLWDVAEGRRIAELDLGGYVRAPEFSPSGGLLGFKTTQGRVAVLGARTGAVVAEIRGQGRIAEFAVRDSGEVDALVADGALHTYPTSRDGLLAAACAALAGTTSAGEVAAACAGR